MAVFFFFLFFAHAYMTVWVAVKKPQCSCSSSSVKGCVISVALKRDEHQVKVVTATAFSLPSVFAKYTSSYESKEGERRQQQQQQQQGPSELSD